VCFTFYDEKYISNDTVPVRYLWNFGNGVIRIGKEVKHCFPGPGVYLVKLSIFDALTGDTITKQVEYLVELENLSQAYIKSDSIGVPGKAIPFEGVTSDLKGAMATKYFWDFGEGFMLGGQFIAKEFKRRGEYSVKLGLHFKTDSLGMLQKTCVVKKIIIN
jgi:PKD repeat protein